MTSKSVDNGLRSGEKASKAQSLPSKQNKSNASDASTRRDSEASRSKANPSEDSDSEALTASKPSEAMAAVKSHASFLGSTPKPPETEGWFSGLLQLGGQAAPAVEQPAVGQPAVHFTEVVGAEPSQLGKPTAMPMAPDRNSVQQVILVEEETAEEDDHDVDLTFLKHRVGTYCSRLHTLRVYDLPLLPWEHEKLVVQKKMGFRAAQVVCWRRTMLEVASLFYFCNFLFSASVIMRSALGDYQDFGDGRVFGMNLGKYAPFFAGYVVWEYFFQSATLGGHFFAFWCVVLAVMRWRRWDRSARMASWAYGIGYITPFILLLVIPFHWGIDVRGIQKQFCMDVLDGAPSINVTGSWGPSRLMNAFAGSNFPGTGRMGSLDNSSTLGLRSLLLAKGVNLPSTEEFCSIDPATWESYIEGLVEQIGRLSKDGTCAAVNISTPPVTIATPGLPDLSQDVAAAIAVCQQAPCLACGSAACIALLPTLQVSTAAAIASVQAQWLSNTTQLPTTPEAALGLWGFNDTTGSVSVCNQCIGSLKELSAVSPSTGEVPSCASLCLPLWAAGQAPFPASATVSTEVVQRLSAAYVQAEKAAQFAAAAGKSAEVARVCVNPKQMSVLQALVSMAAATRPFQTLLGIRLAIRALGILLPSNFAMMLGAFKGACVAKTVVPYSRVPGIILVCAVVFSLPHLTTMVILVKSIIGDGWILVAVLMFLAANMVYLPVGSIFRSLPFLGKYNLFGNGLLEPDTHEEAYHKMERRQRCALAFNIFMAIFLLFWIFASVPLKTFLELGLCEVDFTQFRENFFTLDFLKLVGTNGVNFVCKLYGLSKISAVAFCDAALYAILLIDEANVDPKDDEFREKHGDKVNALFLQLHRGLEPPTKGRQTTIGATVHEEVYMRCPRAWSWLQRYCCCSRRTNPDERSALDKE